MELPIRLTWIRPMLQHNVRTVNKLDPYTRELDKLTSKQKKTDADLARIIQVEARAAAYETEEGLLGLPTDNVWASIHVAAKASKLGEHIKRALTFSLGTVEAVEIAGAKVRVDDFLSDGDNIFYRSVKIGMKRVMRSRPILHDWTTTHTFEFDTDFLNLDRLDHILKRAGGIVGIGDWRPRFGLYEAEIL